MTGLRRLAKTVLGILLVACSTMAGTGHAQITFRAAATASSASGPPAPTFQAAGTAVNATGTVTPIWPAHVAGDVALLFVESAGGEAATLSTPAGFIAVANSPQATGAGTAGTRITVFWARATSAAMAAPTVADPGNHVYAQIITYRGVIATGNPWDVTAGGVKAAASTAVSVTGVTTTVPNTLVVQAVARDDDSNAAEFSAQANATLTGIAERSDAGTTSGNGGGFAVWDGVKAAVGATGNTTATVTSSINAFLTIALEPADASLTINVPAGTTVGDVMVAAIAVTGAAATISPPAGWTAQTATVQATANASRQQLFYRVVSGAEPASYTWTFSAAHTGAVGGIVTYDNVDNTTPIDAFSGNATPLGADTNLQHRVTGVTTTLPDTMVISTHSFSSSSTWTPTGMTERVDLNSGGGTGGISLSMNEVAQAAAGATGNKLATAAANGDSGAAEILVLRPNALPPVLEWAMDQLLWNGTAGEVLDTSGSGLNGRAFGGPTTANLTPALAGDPGTCRYGAFDGNNDYLEVADNALLDITDELTVMAWLRPTAYPAAGLLKSWISKDQNYESHLTSTGTVNWWWGGAPLELTSAGTVALNTWTHVTLVYSRSGGYQRIYLNGVQDANTNNQTAALVVNALPFQVAADQGFAGRNFAGSIDEVRVFRQALGPGRVQQYMNATRPCPVTTDHYAILGSSAGVTCDLSAVQIISHDNTHAAVAPSSGTVLSLSTSTVTGVWQAALLSGTGAWTSSGVNNGVATYVWPGGESSFIVYLRHNTVATVGINVVDNNGKQETPTEDLSIAFADTAFRVTADGTSTATVGTQISGKNSNTGFGSQTLYIQAIRTDTATGSCVGAIQSQTATIQMAGSRVNPTGPTASQVSVLNSSATMVALGTGSGAPGTYTSVTLAFDAQSKAPLVINYPDAGSISLHAQYQLPSPPAATFITGSSNAFVVRPFGFAIRGATAATAVQHVTNDTGAVLAPAGDNFTMTVAAYQWAAGEDSNNDGIPDAGVNLTNNGLTPNFAATVAVAASANLPGVATGSISRGATCASAATIAAGSFSGGSSTIADWCYSEAGNVLLTATSNDYIATGVNIAGNSGLDGSGAAGGYVGRFRPKAFALSGTPTLTNRSAAGCSPVSSFTYMSERLSLGFTLVARNTQGATTLNYNGVYAKLGIGTFANFNFGAKSGATNLISRVDSGTSPSGSWSSGLANVTAGTGILRAISPDGQYTAVQFGIAPVDSDGVAMNALNFDADNNSVNERTNLGVTTEVRFGRMRLDNAFGSTLLDLPVPLTVEYYDSSGVFMLNASDSCTSLLGSDMRFAYVAATPNLTACETAINPGTTIYFVGGKASTTAPPTLTPARLIKPGNNNNGAVDIAINLNAAAGNRCTAIGAAGPAATNANKPWLQGNWGTATYDADPTGRATFGVYKSADQFLFLREVY